MSVSRVVTTLPSGTRLAGYSRTRGTRGFTVLEIVVASSIALFVFAVGYLAISTSIRTSEESTKRIRDTENARLFFNLLERDLQTAFPGPGNIQKKRETLSQTSSYVHDPLSNPPNPSPLVVTENSTGVTASSDILQFYCRSDIPGIRDEVLLVRYYVNRQDHTLCREVVPYLPETNAPPDYMDYNGYQCNPMLLTNVNNSDKALFDNVRQMTITFQQWRPDWKRNTSKENEMIPQAQQLPPQTMYPGADSIVITLIFTDDYKQKRLDPYNPDRTSANYLQNLNKTYRSYAKVLPIPAGFKE